MGWGFVLHPYSNPKEKANYHGYQISNKQTPYNCLPYGDYLEVSGQYGTQFLYTVEVEGMRDRLYATPKLHQKLQDEGIEAGRLFTITKVEGEGNRLNWSIEGELEKGQAETAEVAGPPVEENSQSTGRNAQPNRPNFIHMNHLLEMSLRASWDAWHRLDEGVEFKSEDVRAMGITLFLECSRKGVVLEPEEIPLTLSA